MISADADGSIEIPKRLNPERSAMNRLLASGLLRRIDVNEKQRGGRRGNKELLYFLSNSRANEAIITAAQLCGVGNSKKAGSDYMRGGLKGRHTKVRNDYMIRLILDAQVSGASVPIDEVWGESCPDYPLLGAPIEHDAAGRELDEFEKRKTGYEEVLPDGRFSVCWEDLSCVFDLELELNTEARVLAQKIDARAAALIRMYRDAEKLERAWWRQEIERLNALLRDPGLPPGDERNALQYRASRLMDLQRSHKRGPLPYYAGLPQEIVPVLVLFPTERQARNARQRLLEAPPERYVEYWNYMAEHRIFIEGLFCFPGLDILLDNGIEEPSRTLDACYLPLDLDKREDHTHGGFSLEDIARYIEAIREPARPA